MLNTLFLLSIVGFASTVIGLDVACGGMVTSNPADGFVNIKLEAGQSPCAVSVIGVTLQYVQVQTAIGLDRVSMTLRNLVITGCHATGAAPIYSPDQSTLSNCTTCSVVIDSITTTTTCANGVVTLPNLLMFSTDSALDVSAVEGAKCYSCLDESCTGATRCTISIHHIYGLKQQAFQRLAKQSFASSVTVTKVEGLARFVFHQLAAAADHAVVRIEDLRVHGSWTDTQVVAARLLENSTNSRLDVSGVVADIAGFAYQPSLELNDLYALGVGSTNAFINITNVTGLVQFFTSTCASAFNCVFLLADATNIVGTGTNFGNQFYNGVISSNVSMVATRIANAASCFWSLCVFADHCFASFSYVYNITFYSLSCAGCLSSNATFIFNHIYNATNRSLTAPLAGAAHGAVTATNIFGADSGFFDGGDKDLVGMFCTHQPGLAAVCGNADLMQLFTTFNATITVSNAVGVTGSLDTVGLRLVGSQITLTDCSGITAAFPSVGLQTASNRDSLCDLVTNPPVFLNFLDGFDPSTFVTVAKIMGCRETRGLFFNTTITFRRMLGDATGTPFSVPKLGAKSDGSLVVAFDDACVTQITDASANYLSFSLSGAASPCRVDTNITITSSSMMKSVVLGAMPSSVPLLRIFRFASVVVQGSLAASSLTMLDVSGHSAYIGLSVSLAAQQSILGLNYSGNDMRTAPHLASVLSQVPRATTVDVSDNSITGTVTTSQLGAASRWVVLGRTRNSTVDNSKLNVTYTCGAVAPTITMLGGSSPALLVTGNWTGWPLASPTRSHLSAANGPCWCRTGVTWSLTSSRATWPCARTATSSHTALRQRPHKTGTVSMQPTASTENRSRSVSGTPIATVSTSTSITVPVEPTLVWMPHYSNGTIVKRAPPTTAVSVASVEGNGPFGAKPAGVRSTPHPEDGLVGFLGVVAMSKNTSSSQFTLLCSEGQHVCTPQVAPPSDVDGASRDAWVVATSMLRFSCIPETNLIRVTLAATASASWPPTFNNSGDGAAVLNLTLSPRCLVGLNVTKWMAAPLRLQWRYVAPPTVDITPSATRGIVAVAAGVGALAGSAAGASVAARLSALAAVASCDVSLGKPLDLSSSPMGVAAGDTPLAYHMGAIVGDVLLILAFMTLHAGIGVVRLLYYAGCRTDSRKSWPEGTRSIAAAFAWAHFPSVSFFVVIFFLPPITASSIVCMRYAGTTGHTLVGLIGAAFVLACFMLAARKLSLGRPAWFGAYFSPEHKEEAPSRRPRGNRWWHRLRQAVDWIRTSHGEWDDVQQGASSVTTTATPSGGGAPSFVARYELLFADYTARYRWFLLVDVGVACILAALGSISDADGSCGAMAWAVVTLSAVYPVVLLALRPFRERSEFLFALFVNACQVAAAAVAMKRSQTDDGVPLADDLDTASFGLGLGITAATVAWTLWEVVVMLVGLFWQYIQWLKRGGVKSVTGAHAWLATRWFEPEGNGDDGDVTVVEVMASTPFLSEGGAADQAVAPAAAAAVTPALGLEQQHAPPSSSQEPCLVMEPLSAARQRRREMAFQARSALKSVAPPCTTACGTVPPVVIDMKDI